jgi:16S rRNA (cytidine1402-2'-O)-methyltransferase
MEKGILYIVATPIGNLEDITLRALRILKEVNLIAAEDTRITRKLLSHYDIHTQLTSYFEHNSITKGNYLIGLLKQGKNIAIVSSAGTPGISDPGYPLIKSAVENNIPVVPIPGPSAIITALVSSGLPTSGFVFLGFPPRKEGKLKRLLEKSAILEKTIVLYESPFRVMKTLGVVKEVMGNADVVIAREITKKFEEIIRGKVVDILNNHNGMEIKGEVILLISAHVEKAENT